VAKRGLQTYFFTTGGHHRYPCCPLEVTLSLSATLIVTVTYLLIYLFTYFYLLTYYVTLQVLIYPKVTATNEKDLTSYQEYKDGPVVTLELIDW